MSKKYLRDLIPLVAICLISALLLASFNLLTKDSIAENTRLAAEQTRTRMLASAVSFEALELEDGSNMDSFFQGLDESGEPIGYVIQTTVNGYGGEVVVTLGMDMNGAITGVDVGGENFSETPGLGALAKEPAFTDQYIGKSAPLTLVKSNEPKGDNTIDAISGATRTSSAVNGGVNLACKYIIDLTGDSSPNTASAQGFAGPVAVTLELDGDGKIASIVIGDDYFNETEGYGKKALDESFYGQFIGMQPPLVLSDIDAISGATVTSTAVVNAINTVYAQLTGEDAPVAPAPTDPAGATTVASTALDAAAVLDGNGDWTAGAKGFAGSVTVILSLDGLTISAIEIGDESFAETDGFGAKALEDEFKSQFVGKTLPVTADDIDAISGATITTNAVLTAIDSIYQAAGDAEPAAATNTAVQNDSGDWMADAKGFAGPVTVKLSLDGLTISAIEIGDESFAETDGFGAKALEDEFKSQFVGRTLPVTADDIDAISGATITTNAVLTAIDGIYQAAGDAEPAAVADATEAPAATIEPTAAPTATVVPTAAPTATAKPAVAPTATLAPSATELLTTVTSQTAPVSSPGADFTASAQGYAGPVAVKLSLDGLTISAIEIGDESFAETAGLGAKALEDEFMSQFIGRTLPLTADDIDAISGATITTNAVLAAIDGIYQEVSAPGADLTASAQGYAGPVTVKLSLDGLTISAIEIGDESFAETAGLGAKALEDAFMSQFIGKTLPLTADDIDAISGATITTNAVLDAIQQIYAARK